MRNLSFNRPILLELELCIGVIREHLMTPISLLSNKKDEWNVNDDANFYTYLGAELAPYIGIMYPDYNDYPT